MSGRAAPRAAALGGALAAAAFAAFTLVLGMRAAGAQPAGAAERGAAPVVPNDTAGASSAPRLDLARYRWRNRLLLLFAPSAEDSLYRTDAAALRERAADVRERDLLAAAVFERGPSAFDGRPLAAADAAALRQRFRAVAGRFTAVLVGKDGHAAIRSAAPVVAGRLFPAIDAMPMRREEMRRGRSGAR